MKKFSFKKIKFLPLFLLFQLLFLYILEPTRFYSLDNIQNMFFQFPEICMISLALMLTFVVGEINLSVVSIASFSGVLAAKLFLTNNAIDNMLLRSVLSIIFILLFSSLLGLMNGYIVAYIGVSSILLTIGATTVYEGIMGYITKGASVSNFDKSYYTLGKETLLGIPIPLIILLVLLIFITYLLSYTNIGRYVLYVGLDEQAANYSGINIKKVKMLSYMISGMVSGFVAIVMSARYNSISPSYGASYLIFALVAVSLSGINLDEGKAKITNLIISVLILHVFSTGLNLFGLNRNILDVIMGILVLVILYLKQYEFIGD